MYVDTYISICVCVCTFAGVNITPANTVCSMSSCYAPLHTHTLVHSCMRIPMYVYVCSRICTGVNITPAMYGVFYELLVMPLFWIFLPVAIVACFAYDIAIK